jgi:hypothetical protein
MCVYIIFIKKFVKYKLFHVFKAAQQNQVFSPKVLFLNTSSIIFTSITYTHIFNSHILCILKHVLYLMRINDDDDNNNIIIIIITTSLLFIYLRARAFLYLFSS